MGGWGTLTASLRAATVTGQKLSPTTTARDPRTVIANVPPPSSPPTRAAVLVFVCALVVAGALSLYMLASFFAAIVLALVLVALSRPLHARTRARVHEPRAAATIVTVILVVGVLLPTAALVLAFVEQGVSLVQRASDGAFAREVRSLLAGEGAFLGEARALLARLGVDLTPDDVAALVEDVGRRLVAAVSARVSSLPGDVITLFVHFGVMAVLVFAFHLHGDTLLAFAYDLSPLPDDEDALLAGRFQEIARAVFLGNGVASAAQGLVGGVLFFAFDIGPPVVWGTIITVLAFLPIVGASFVFVPAALYLALKTGLSSSALYLALSFVTSVVFETWLKPRLIGGRASMSAVLIFLGILAGLASFGVLGLFLGPLLLTVFLTLVELWRTRYRGSLFSTTTGPASS